MKYTIDISIIDNTEPTLCPVFYDEESKECVLSLTISSDTNIEEVLKKDKAVKLLMDGLKTNTDLGNMLFDQDSKIIIKMILDSSNLLEECSDISFIASTEIKEYIERNPILKKYPMHLMGNYSIDSKVGNEIYELFGEYENVYLQFDGNKEQRHISEYKKTIDAIDEIVHTIKKYNLSTLEEIMFAYDLVRDRVYTKELDTEDETVSRDLSSVLFGNKIVCAGYVAIFNSVLKNLGVNVMDYKLLRKDNNKKGHVRTLAYINDKKYNVNGIFMFDPTWDSKREEGDKSFLTSYKFFCKSKDEFRFFDQEYDDITIPLYSKNFTPRLKKTIETDGIENINEEIGNTLCNIGILVDGKSPINKIIFSTKAPKEIRKIFANLVDKEELNKTLDKYQSLFYGNSLDLLTLLEIIYNVRKREYYEFPNKYPLDINSIKKAVIGSTPIDSKLLQLILGLPEKLTSEEFDEWKNENDIERNIEGVKLTRKLKSILDTKN